MAKYEPKTRVNDASVTDFINGVKDEDRRNDCFEVMKLMQQVTKEPPKMWGSSIVGFGRYEYESKGCKGEWMLTGFSPRKQNLTLYLMGGFDKQAALLEKLGKHSHSVGCLYLKTLDDVDKKILKELVQASVKQMKDRFMADRKPKK
jgi:hypothetical protein